MGHIHTFIRPYLSLSMGHIEGFYAALSKGADFFYAGEDVWCRKSTPVRMYGAESLRR